MISHIWETIMIERSGSLGCDWRDIYLTNTNMFLEKEYHYLWDFRLYWITAKFFFVMKLFFLTSNKKKYDEIKSFLKIPIHHIHFECPEIQGTAHEVIVHKLLKARKYLCQTDIKEHIIIMDDSCIHINGLYGFPGVYAKDFLKIGFDAIIEIVTKVGREVKMTCQLGLLYNDLTKIFMGTTDGTIGTYDANKSGPDFDSIAFVNEKRLSDLSIDEKNIISARGKACLALQEFLIKKKIIDKLE